ncbi:MAG TPA: hypothetical protein VMY37_14105 [Thermoguttaceae bacterium]|nr:hypothetical protein [Thermoguttaceae bacterium]
MTERPEWSDRLRPYHFAAFVEHKRKGFVGREWLFAQIDAWRHDADERALLIRGDAGVGKSAALAQLAHTNPGGRVLAYHFCQADVPETLEPGRFVGSLAGMIARGLDSYAARLEDSSIREALSPWRCETDPAGAFGEGVLGPLDALDAPESGVCYVVVDALDEAMVSEDPVSQTTIVEVLASRLDQLPTWLRIVVTARDEEPVVERLPGLRVCRIDAGDERNLEDVRRYVARRLARQKLAEQAGAARMSREQVAEILEKKSGGSFLYVEQAFEGLEGGQYDFEDLAALPGDVGGLYRRFFEHQFPDETSFAQAKRVLQVVTAAGEPLTEAQLAAAADLDAESELPAVLKTLSVYLLNRDQAEGPARYALCHGSLHDWLAGAEHCGGVYQVGAKSGHERLADAGWKEYQQDPRSMSPYALAHLPAHLTAAERWDDLGQLLTDLPYLEAKAERGLVFPLSRDFAAAAAEMPAEHASQRTLKLLDEALRRDVRFIARHPATLFQCLWNSSWWHDSPESVGHYELPVGVSITTASPQGRVEQKLCDLLQAWRTAKQSRSPDFPWVRSVRPPASEVGGGKHAVLRGHERGVLSVACLADGKRVCSGALDETVRVWDAQSGAELHCLRAHEKGVRSVAHSPDGRHLVSGSLDQTLRVWDATNGAEVRCLRGHARDVTCVACSPDGRQIASGSLDQTVRVWDAQSGAELRCFRGHASAVYAVAFSPDGAKVVSGSKDRTVRVWDVRSGAQLSCLEGHAGDVTAVDWLGGGQTVVSGSKDQTVRVWDAEAGAELRCLRGHARDVTGVACSPDGRRIVSSSLDQTVRVWDAGTGAELRCLRGHVRDVTSVDWSADGSLIASGSWDEAVRLWDAESTAEIRCLRGHDDWVRSVTYSPDGRQVASGSVDRTVRLWDAQSGVQLLCLTGHVRDVVTAAYSPNGRKIATGSFDKTVRIWDTQTGAELRCLRGHRSSLYSVVYSPDGREIASGSLDQTVRVWDAETGAEVHCLHGHDYWVLKVVYSADGRRIVSAALDQTLRVWDARAGTELHVLRGHEMDVTSVDCSPDGHRIVSGSLDQTVRLWDAERGVEVACLRGHERGVVGVAWSPEGQRIASVSFDQTVRVWDAESGECVQVIQGQGDVSAIAREASRGGWRALACGQETVIESVATAEPVARFPEPMEQIVTHPEGRSWAGATANHVQIITLEGATEPGAG